MDDIHCRATKRMKLPLWYGGYRFSTHFSVLGTTGQNWYDRLLDEMPACPQCLNRIVICGKAKSYLYQNYNSVDKYGDDAVVLECINL